MIPLPGVLGRENPLDLRGWSQCRLRATANHYLLVAAAAAGKRGGGGDDGGDDGGAESVAAIAAKSKRKTMLLGKVMYRVRWQRKTWPRRESRKSTNGSSASSGRNTSV